MKAKVHASISADRAAPTFRRLGNSSVKGDGGSTVIRAATVTAIELLSVTAALELLLPPHRLLLVFHPLYVTTLVAAALLSAVLFRDLRGLPFVRFLAVPAATLALQLAIVVAWGASVSLVLTYVLR